MLIGVQELQMTSWHLFYLTTSLHFSVSSWTYKGSATFSYMHTPYWQLHTPNILLSHNMDLLFFCCSFIAFLFLKLHFCLFFCSWQSCFIRISRWFRLRWTTGKVSILPKIFLLFPSIIIVNIDIVELIFYLWYHLPILFLLLIVSLGRT